MNLVTCLKAVKIKGFQQKETKNFKRNKVLFKLEIILKSQNGLIVTVSKNLGVKTPL